MSDTQTEKENSAMMMSMMPPSLSLEEVLAHFHNFNHRFNSLILGTINADGDADTSYTPTLQQDGKFYVFVSELAAHTKNLLRHPNASILLIEPETEANLFRRQRSMIRASVRWIGREEDEWSSLLDRYEQVLGKMMRNLRSLQDFHLFELTPLEATYVRGFGQAYKISGNQLASINHIRDRKHGQSTLKISNNVNE